MICINVVQLLAVHAVFEPSIANDEQVNAKLSFKYVIFFIAFPGSFIFSYQVLVNGMGGGSTQWSEQYSFQMPEVGVWS